MSFIDLRIKEYYFSPEDDMVEDFYVPLLRQSILYQRSVGFFSSSALIELSKGIAELVKNDGHVQIIASPRLSKEDVWAIEEGIQRKEQRLEAYDKFIEEKLLEQIWAPKNYEEEERLNFMVHLIAAGRLEIKIAVMMNCGKTGMYHEKLGLLYDKDDNVVAFSGSMNESTTALENNAEGTDVFCSWMGGGDYRRVQKKREHFENMWKNQESGVKIYDFPEAAKEKLFQYRKSDEIDLEFENQFRKKESQRKEEKHPHIASHIKIRSYQKEAIRTWAENGYRGIFDMATGTGKTYTAIGAICHLYENLKKEKKPLAVIIVCPFQHLVEQWVEDLMVFGIEPVVGYGNPKYRGYEKKLRTKIFRLSLGTESFMAFITTMSSFRSRKVQEKLEKIQKDCLLVVDEAHNMGAKSYREMLTEKYTYRLALSATFERYEDEEGTEYLYQYFGEKSIEYTLERAIKEGMLTRYYYYPIPIYLSDEELEEYERLSGKIAKYMVSQKKGKEKRMLSETLKQLLIERSRISAGAIAKIEGLKKAIEPYKEDNHILVYCGATRVHEWGFEVENEENDIRQIDKVTQMLGLEMGMKVAQFTSRENAQTRNILRQEFSLGEDLQALVAIKCLDEGVNIPAVKTAFLLASTTNPKEYIQRRGRVLRLAKGKDFAYIYDFVTLPRDLEMVKCMLPEEYRYDKALVRSELNRVEEFRRLSENSFETLKMVLDIRDAYNLYETEDEEKDGYEI